MGSFFKDVRKLFISLENSKNHTYAKRGKNILSVLSHLPTKKAKSISKRASFVERNENSLLEEAFRIHIRDRKKRYRDPFSGKEELFFIELIYSGDDIVVRWPTGYRVFDLEEIPEKKIIKDIDGLLRKMITDIELPPEKELFSLQYRKYIS